MDPYQRNQDAPGGNPYEFILNPEQNSKKKFRIGKGGNKLLFTLVIIIVSVIAFMILVTVLLTAFAPKKIGKAEFLSLAQTQTELIRIADQGSRSSRQQVTKNLATTVHYTLLTQQKPVLAQVGKVNKKELSLKQNATTDQQLASATATSTYDAAITKIIESELNNYATELKKLFDLAKTDKDRDMMSDYYKQTQLLLAQVPYAQDGLQASGQ